MELSSGSPEGIFLGSHLKIQELSEGTGQLLKVGANRPSHFGFHPTNNQLALRLWSKLRTIASEYLA
jgi:hypothetical protein